jgi:hypothetical protein
LTCGNPKEDRPIYYYLVQALKRRLILELQDSFAQHPVYRKIVPYIQNKFAFDERPQYGIIVTGSSASKVQLDPSNYMGTIQSHVMLAKAGGQTVFPLEWVREDQACVRDNNGVIPTPPGVYYLEILEAPTDPVNPGFFAFDPLLTVTNEPVIILTPGMDYEGQLQAVPVPGTLRLYQNSTYSLKEGVDYILEAQGQIKFLYNFPPYTPITADYRYAGPSLGPVPFRWNTADATTLPGVVMAFGKRAEKGQKVAIVVYDDRVSTAEAYGGKYEVNFDLTILARDPQQLEEISDLVNMFLWGEKRGPLGFEGIEVLDVSMGGEGEEPIDETGQDFQYTSNGSVQLRADWEIHVPLPLTISRVDTVTVQSINTLFFQTMPIFEGRNADYERIG